MRQSEWICERAADALAVRAPRLQALPRLEFDCILTVRNRPQLRNTTASCYGCHADLGASDATFVQYYPTLLPISQSKNTLSAAYKRGIDNAAPEVK
jgi:hypothetical protein